MENHFTETGKTFFLAPNLLVYFTKLVQNHFSLGKKLFGRAPAGFSGAAENQLWKLCQTHPKCSRSCGVIDLSSLHKSTMFYVSEQIIPLLKPKHFVLED